MKAIVTGSTGFIGSNLCRMLTAQGWEVATIGRIETLEEYARGIDSMKSFGPDVVFHLASLFLSNHSAIQVGPLIAGNLLFGSQVLEMMAQTGVRRIINAGTSWQYPAPRNLYAATKQAFESILEFYCHRYGIGAVTLNLFDTYGFGDTRGKLVDKLIGHLSASAAMPMLPKHHKIDLCHVDDVCRAFVHAVEQAESGGHETFMLSAGHTSLKTLVETLQSVSGKKLNADWGARAYRPGETAEPWNDGIPLPGWEPQVSLADGLARMRWE